MCLCVCPSVWWTCQASPLSDIGSRDVLKDMTDIYSGNNECRGFLAKVYCYLQVRTFSQGLSLLVKVSRPGVFRLLFNDKLGHGCL